MSAMVEKLIQSLENRKCQSADFEEHLAILFDVPKTDGTWFCSKDNKLYRKQIDSGGRAN